MRGPDPEKLIFVFKYRPHGSPVFYPSNPPKGASFSKILGRIRNFLLSVPTYGNKKKKLG